jgi:hypothetical protein
VILDLERKSAAIPASDEMLLTELRQADAGGYLPGYASAALIPESSVFAYNRGNAVADEKTTPPKEPLVVSYPADGPVVTQVPFVTLTAARKDPARSKAIDEFQAMLLGEAGQAAFIAEGLRTANGSNSRLTRDAGFSSDLRSGAVASPARRRDRPRLRRSGTCTGGERRWPCSTPPARWRRRCRVPEARPGSRWSSSDGDGDQTSRRRSNLGVWQFASTLDGDTDYRELVPIGPMIGTVDGVPRSEASLTAIRSMKPAGRTGLYDTALAAFDTLSAAYTPGRPNQVVLLTDGKNDDPGGISLDDLVTALKQKFEPGAARPPHHDRLRRRTGPGKRWNASPRRPAPGATPRSTRNRSSGSSSMPCPGRSDYLIQAALWRESGTAPPWSRGDRTRIRAGPSRNGGFGKARRRRVGFACAGVRLLQDLFDLEGAPDGLAALGGACAPTISKQRHEVDATAVLVVRGRS